MESFTRWLRENAAEAEALSAREDLEPAIRRAVLKRAWKKLHQEFIRHYSEQGEELGSCFLQFFRESDRFEDPKELATFLEGLATRMEQEEETP